MWLHALLLYGLQVARVRLGSNSVCVCVCVCVCVSLCAHILMCACHTSTLTRSMENKRAHTRYTHTDARIPAHKRPSVRQCFLSHSLRFSHLT
jgi:hypothetical protein